MPQGRFLEYVDELERLHRKQQLELASYIGLAIAGGEDGERTWSQLWESTMTDEELEAQYAAGRDELGRRAEGGR